MKLSPSDRVWVLAPHADDEVLGAGGVLSLCQKVGCAVFVQFLTAAGYAPRRGGIASSTDQRLREVEACMAYMQIAGYDVMPLGQGAHLRLDTLPQHDIVDWIENRSSVALNVTKPTLVLLPSAKHNHQDHLAAWNASVSALRTGAISGMDAYTALAYEIPGTGQFGVAGFEPSVYVRLAQDDLDRKCSAFQYYQTQVAPTPSLRSDHAIRCLATYRGLEIGASFAEGYELVRAVL